MKLKFHFQLAELDTKQDMGNDRSLLRPPKRYGEQTAQLSPKSPKRLRPSPDPDCLSSRSGSVFLDIEDDDDTNLHSPISPSVSDAALASDLDGVVPMDWDPPKTENSDSSICYGAVRTKVLGLELEILWQGAH